MERESNETEIAILPTFSVCTHHSWLFNRKQDFFFDRASGPLTNETDEKGHFYTFELINFTETPPPP